jgi:hypothetical protein
VLLFDAIPRETAQVLRKQPHKKLGQDYYRKYCRIAVNNRLHLPSPFAGFLYRPEKLTRIKLRRLREEV